MAHHWLLEDEELVSPLLQRCATYIELIDSQLAKLTKKSDVAVLLYGVREFLIEIKPQLRE